MAGQLNLSISSEVILPSREGAAERAGTLRLCDVISERPDCDGVSNCDGVCWGPADRALLSFSIVGQADGDGMTIEG